ncbi:MAG: Rid family detoxifying hydrolase [Coriobacteriia bacterium]|nr:Rid family detoxifying hydrolase [Coriobacteriia bacterium]
MDTKVVSSDKGFPAVGPYSPSILVDGRVQFISGQLGADPETGQLKETLEEQIVQTFANVEALLVAADMGFENVVKTTVFLRDMNDFAVANKIYASYFSDNPPARSCFAVAGLPLDALYEIEAIAVK